MKTKHTTLTKADVDSAMAEIVNAFLRWPLPKSVCADRCATLSDYPHPRSGTNLMTCPETVGMVQDVVRPVFERLIPEDAFTAQWYPLAEFAAPEGKQVLFAWVRGKGDGHTMRTGTSDFNGVCRPSGPNDTWRTQPTHWRELPVLNVV